MNQSAIQTIFMFRYSDGRHQKKDQNANLDGKSEFLRHDVMYYFDRVDRLAFFRLDPKIRRKSGKHALKSIQ